MDKKKRTKREEFTTKIGPLMKSLLQKQKEKVKYIAYDVVIASDWEAGEILAKKVIEKGIL